MRASLIPHPEEPLRELWLPLCPQAYLYVCRRPCHLCVRVRVPGREALRGRCSGPSACVVPIGGQPWRGKGRCQRWAIRMGFPLRIVRALHVGHSGGAAGGWGGLGLLVLVHVLFGEVWTSHGGWRCSRSRFSSRFRVVCARFCAACTLCDRPGHPLFLRGDYCRRAFPLRSRPRPQSTGRRRASAGGRPARAGCGTSSTCRGASRTASVRARRHSRRRLPPPLRRSAVPAVLLAVVNWVPSRCLPFPILMGVSTVVRAVWSRGGVEWNCCCSDAATFIAM